MTNLSTDRLEKIAELARKYHYKPDEWHRKNLMNECGADVIERMARELLAYRRASSKTVAWTDKMELDDMNNCGRARMFKSRRAMGKPDPDSVVKLYAAPQLTVVPPAIKGIDA